MGDAEKSVAKVLRRPSSGELELKILNRPLVTERVTTKTAKATSGHHTKSSFATQDREAKYNVTSGHLKAKILNRRLDTKNVPAKKSKQRLDTRNSLETETHEAKAASRDQKDRNDQTQIVHSRNVRNH